MSWFVRSFGVRYSQLYSHRDETEAARALALLAPEEGWIGRDVLDLACGAGRYTRRLRQEGARPVGLDLSPVLLAEARWAEPALAYLRADMRRIPLRSASVDDCLSMFTSFGYFESVSEHALLAAEMARVSRARVVLDVPNPDALAASLVPQSEREFPDFLVREERWIDESPRRVRKRIEIRSFDGESLESYEESVMLFDLEQLREFFETQGLMLTRCHGSYGGEDFHRDASARQLCVFTRSGH